MNRDLEECTREELIAYIEKLKRQNRKRFGLVWEEKIKPEKVVEECETKLPVVKEVEERAIECAPGKPTNIIIEGDNYHALSVLNYTHAGKIDVIYIDPPYNTGNKDFIYNDCYVDKEDTFRHSKWLSFMEKRLRLAKNLLADDGVIFISIDDNEYATLKLLCDSVFGDNNFINSFVWINNLKGRQISGVGAAGTHEFIICYAKRGVNISNFFADSSFLKQCMPSTYKGFDYEVKTDRIGQYIITNELYNSNSAFNEETRPNLVFDIWYNEKSGDICFDDPKNSSFTLIEPHKNSDGVHKWHAYRWSREKIEREKENLEFVKDGNTFRIYTKRRDYCATLVKDVITDINTTNGSLDLKALKMEKLFDYPKPVKLIELLINCSPKKDAFILDFFAGSGTTGQAVMELNKEDGGHRQFILVTNNEANGQADAGAEGIAEKVTYPRIKTVITGIRPDGTKYSDGIPANLRYFKTDFVEKGKTTDDTREALITECCDMIRMRENAFEHVASAPEYRFYKNDKVFVPIIFDQFAIAETWELVEKLNTEKLPVHCYNFSYNRHANEEEIPEDTELTWTACSIPETVLEVYRKIFRKKKEV